MSKVDCHLCDAIAEAEGSAPGRIENTPLRQTGRFILIPSVGPLNAGQSLVVSRRHFPSLAAMEDEALEEYDRFAHSLLGSRNGWLEAEHGSTDTDCAGACVTHTHVHLLPNLAEFESIFDGVLPLIYRGDKLVLPPQGTPYIFLRANLGEVRIFNGANLPSQMLRQTICGALGRDDWDWRTLPRHHLIRETLDHWSQTNE